MNQYTKKELIAEKDMFHKREDMLTERIFEVRMQASGQNAHPVNISEASALGDIDPQVLGEFDKTRKQFWQHVNGRKLSDATRALKQSADGRLKLQKHEKAWEMHRKFLRAPPHAVAYCIQEFEKNESEEAENSNAKQARKSS